MSTKRITIEGLGTMKLSSAEGFAKMKEDKGVLALVDSNGIVRINFASLVDGGKYTCTFRNPQQQQEESNALRQRIMLANPKASLRVGKGVRIFAGLKDRDSSMEQLYQGLEYLAQSRGRQDIDVDKKEVPVLAIAAPSKSGKTEFLRWIFNNCCSYNEDSGKIAKDVLKRVNDASPKDAPKLDRILVLFASFNQESPYTPGEGPIKTTTIERLVRSFEGRLDMRAFDAASSTLHEFEDLVGFFSSESKTTGFIVCIDELSNLREIDRSEYTKLMDDLLGFSQYTIQKGGYFAFVGTSLRIYDFGETVLQASGRALRPIKFPSPNAVVEATRSLVKLSQVFAGAEAREAQVAFDLEVAVQVARSSPKMSYWVDLAESQSKINIPQEYYTMPTGIDADYVFLVAAQTALKTTKTESMDPDTLHAIMNELEGDAKLHDTRNHGVYLQWPISVALSLPPWRLLQFKFAPHKQLFSHVQNWVLVELHGLFYTDRVDKSKLPLDYHTVDVNTWELATMGLLELRKAMLQVIRSYPPSLRDIVGEAGVFMNVSDELLDKTAMAETASNSFRDLPLGSESCDQPCFYYAKKSNEEGVDGVFRSGFDGLDIFFQMKLYHNPTPEMIKEWLEKAHRHAKDLVYEEGTYVVQLFVTGAKEENIQKYYNEWAQNSIVFADDAIQHLLEPFGAGLFPAMVKAHRREKERKEPNE